LSAGKQGRRFSRLPGNHGTPLEARGGGRGDDDGSGLIEGNKRTVPEKGDKTGEKVREDVGWG